MVWPVQYASAQAVTNLPPIPGAPTPTSPATFVVYLFFAAFAFTGIAVGVGFLWGAALYFFSAGFPEKKSEGKDRMKRAFLGFAILISAVFILYTINPDLVRLRDAALPRVELPAAEPGQVGIPGGTGSIAGGSGPCMLQDAQWSTTVQWAPPVVAPGTQLSLVVSGSGCPSASTVNFIVFKRTALGASQVATLSAPASASVGQWQAPQVTSDTTYYFDAAIQGITISSPDITVSISALAVSECIQLGSGGTAPTSCAAPCETTVPSCRSFILTAASQHNISAALLVAIMEQENNSGNPSAVNVNASGEKDCGLMQVNSTTLAGSACNTTGSTDPTTICQTLVNNPGMNIAVGACILKTAQQTAAGAASAYQYPIPLIQLTAAEYNAGSRPNDLSCNCRLSSSSACPGQPVCLSCATHVPRWACPKGQDGACTDNIGYAVTRNYAPSVEKNYFHYLNCPTPNNWP